MATPQKPNPDQQAIDDILDAIGAGKPTPEQTAALTQLSEKLRNPKKETPAESKTPEPPAFNPDREEDAPFPIDITNQSQSELANANRILTAAAIPAWEALEKGNFATAVDTFIRTLFNNPATKNLADAKVGQALEARKSPEEAKEFLKLLTPGGKNPIEKSAPTPPASSPQPKEGIEIQLSSEILQFRGRDICQVILPDGKEQGFYKSTGKNSGRPGEWFPFDGIGIRFRNGMQDWFDKTPYIKPDPKDPLHRYGTEELRDIGKYLSTLQLPAGKETKDRREVNDFLSTIPSHPAQQNQTRCDEIEELNAILAEREQSVQKTTGALLGAAATAPKEQVGKPGLTIFQNAIKIGILLLEILSNKIEEGQLKKSGPSQDALQELADSQSVLKGKIREHLEAIGELTKPKNNWRGLLNKKPEVEITR